MTLATYRHTRYVGMPQLGLELHLRRSKRVFGRYLYLYFILSTFIWRSDRSHERPLEVIYIISD